MSDAFTDIVKAEKSQREYREAIMTISGRMVKQISFLASKEHQEIKITEILEIICDDISEDVEKQMGWKK